MYAPRPFLLALLALLFCIGRAHATTWDEPWHGEVVSTATAFGLYEVVKSAPHSVTLKRLKYIAGEDTGPTVRIKSFYALRLTSFSGQHVPEFRLPPGGRAYFFLKRASNAWTIATPTSGFAGLRTDGAVLATYRFSAHQAIIDAKLYEDTQRCIFQTLHGGTKCDPQVAAFIATELAKPAEGVETVDANQSPGGFFRQHAALETAGFTHQPLPEGTLERFLSKSDMHVQLSALRALAASPRVDKAEQLMRFIRDERASLTARIMAAVLIKEIGAREMKQRLLDYVPQASEEEAGLGINVMDPRIGTNFPSNLKQAVKLAGEKL